ncbi:MAG: lipopolysaccharide biosynthesis protein [Chitinophagaceae bacterium]|nr:MAG: lipopolysaccharide biosynthesis protein [Chitinophagaceae bacterium]
MTSNSGSKEKIEEISLREILLKIREWTKYLIGKWKWITLFALIGVILGLAHAFLKVPVYTAKITFVTENKEQSSAIGAYAGLAAQFGINMGSGVNSDLFSSDNIFDLMKTRLILQKTLLAPAVFKGKKTLFINWYVSIEKELRRKHSSWENMAFDPPDSTSFNREQNSMIEGVCNYIRGSLKNVKGSIMEVDFTSPDEIFSQEFLETLIQNTGQFYIATKTKRSRDNIAILQKQLDSVRSQLFGAMGNVAAFNDFNPNLVRDLPRVQQQKSSLNVNINSAIYQQLVTGLEAAKMNLLKETPLFEVIDEPVLPLDENKASKVKWGVMGALLGIILSATWLLMRRIYNEIIATEE